ncbi:thyrostimulin alpha-2 subunit-like [Amphibalanus amphitrite]|uniref:thyrostimulin alpha-2 subunit-like n=1 Tax=Amphibalanus amphitrite TaxID=1232801 RepID=UPI001C8FED9D|nr:thyrostimulin alpha-2 subunit-like [Amphibalanus amphitrite]
MSALGGRVPLLVPLLALLATLVSSGVSRRLSPWEMAERAELLLEEVADDLLAQEEEQGEDGRKAPAPAQFQSRCELVGHTQLVQVRGCAPVELTVNACDGMCGSSAHPSSWHTLSMNPRHAVTSVGQCCNIMETKNVSIKMECINGPKHVKIKSAKSCACFHCKKT